MSNEIIQAFEEEFTPMKAEINKQWFGVFKAGYQAALEQSEKQAQQDSPLEKVEPFNQSFGNTGQLKLLQAVDALAGQTGEPAEAIIEWLTEKDGLTQLMLSHFGGSQSPRSSWVSAKERLPANCQKVDILIKSSHIENYLSRETDIVYVGEAFQRKMAFYGDYVSHWMPLPLPPTNEVNKPEGDKP